MHKFIILLLSLTVFYAAHNYIWLTNNSPIPLNPSEIYKLVALAEQQLPISGVKEAINIIRHGQYCPIYFFNAALFNNIFGKSIITSCMGNIFWFILTLVGIYLLTAETFNKTAGLWAILLFSFFPITYGSSRHFEDSFGLMALTPFLFLFLFKSNKFNNLLYSCLFGLFVGLSFMIKKSAVVFIMPPAIYFIISALKIKDNLKNRIINATLSIIIFILIISWRYWNFEHLQWLFTVPFEEAEPSLDFFTKYLEVFVVGIINYQLSLPFFILFIYGIFQFLKSPTVKYKKIIYLLWIIFPIVFFTIIPHRKMLRVIIPYLPAIAVISAYGLTNIKNIIIRYSAYIAVIIIGLIQFYDFSFFKILDLHTLSIKTDVSNIRYFNCLNYSESYYPSLTTRPEKDTGYQELVSTICSSRFKNPKIMLFPCYLGWQPWYLYFLFNNFPIDIYYSFPKNHDIQELLKYMQEQDPDLMLFNEQIKDGLPSYFKTIIDNRVEVYATHPAPYSRIKHIELINFLKTRYPQYLIDFQTEFSHFKPLRVIRANNNNYYLYERTEKKHI